MAPANWQEWIAWGGVVVPALALGWAACFFTWNQRQEAKRQQFERVFKVMDHLGQPGGSVASKMAAAYELRKYKAYAPVILRLCEQVEVEGHAAAMLKRELELTANEMRRYV